MKPMVAELKDSNKIHISTISAIIQKTFRPLVLSLVLLCHWQSSRYLDLDSLSTTTPTRRWQQAGLNSAGAKEATVVIWMYFGVFFTREFLYNVKS